MEKEMLPYSVDKKQNQIDGLGSKYQMLFRSMLWGLKRPLIKHIHQVMCTQGRE